MSAITTNEIIENPNSFLSRVHAGESMVLINEGLSVAEITPLPLVSKELRPIGLCKGQVFISDDFDDPLPEDILALFEGRS